MTAGERAATGAAPAGSRRGWFVLAGIALVVGGAVAIDKEVADEVHQTFKNLNERVGRELDKAGVGSTSAPKAGAGSAQPGSASAEAGDPDDKQPAAQDYNEPPLGSDGWVNERDLSMPTFNPHDVDISAVLTLAVAEAHRMLPEAQLVRYDADNVDRKGHADLTLSSFASDTGSVDIRFVVPSRVPPNPDKPRPFGYAWKCEFRIEADPDGIHVRPMDFPCIEPVVPLPHCTPATVWAHLHVQVPPSSPRATLDYRRGPSDKPSWWFTVYGVADDIVVDACQ